MKVSIWWILPVFYAGLFLGMVIIALCQSAKAGNEQPKPEKPAPEQKPEEPAKSEVDLLDADLRRNIVRMNPGLASRPNLVRQKLILGRPGRG